MCPPGSLKGRNRQTGSPALTAPPHGTVISVVHTADRLNTPVSTMAFLACGASRFFSASAFREEVVKTLDDHESRGFLAPHRGLRQSCTRVAGGCHRLLAARAGNSASPRRGLDRSRARDERDRDARRVVTGRPEDPNFPFFSVRSRRAGASPLRPVVLGVRAALACATGRASRFPASRPRRDHGGRDRATRLETAVSPRANRDEEKGA
jgi:hypothetical protein